MSITARHETTCPLCAGTIVRGERITRTPEGYAHDECTRPDDMTICPDCHLVVPLCGRCDCKE